MRATTSTFVFAVLFAGVTALPAAANCGRYPQTALQDGSKACVVSVTTTEFTQTQSIEGAGPAAMRSRKFTGGAVVMRMLGEPTAKATTRNKIRRRAMAVCRAYKDQFAGKVGRGANPYMVVVFGWGNAPSKSSQKGRLSDTHREFYLTRNCGVTFSQ